MTKLIKIFSYGLIGIAFIFVIGLGIDTVNTVPDYALVFINVSKNEYLAPPCLMEYGADNIEEINLYAQKHSLIVVQYRYIKGKKMFPNEECKENNGFMEEGRSITGLILEKIGICQKFNTRWNQNGTWKE